MTTTAISTDNPQGAGPPVGQILLGDARTRLAELPAESVDTVITSPPYFMLRNYGVTGQIGAEESVDGWANQLLGVLEEVGRVLKPHGSVWLNLGDTYSRHCRHGAAPKSLLLGPERLVLALSRAGWSVRNKVVWAKPNPMPTSVKDRLSATWEPLYLLTRSQHYFFDIDAIRVPSASKLHRPAIVGRHTKYHVEGRKHPEWSGPLAGTNSGLEAMKARGQSSHRLGKNPGDVWTVATAAYRGAHFATFPPDLIRRPMQATCPERTCSTCGTPWWRAPTVAAIGATAVKGALRKSCACPDRSWQPGVVLDPFMGAGTVGLVAEELSRRWVGIELKDEYRRQAMQRIIAARGIRKGGPRGTSKPDVA